MAGASLALAIDTLVQQSITIAVIESALPESDHPGYDARSIALAYGSCQLLKDIKIWDKLEPVASAIQSIHVSDRGHFGLTEMTAEQQHLPFLGQVIELADAGHIFHDALMNAPNIQLFCPDQIQQISREPDQVIATLESGQQLRAKLFIAADGAVSSCCQMLDITQMCHDFQQTAIIANITTDQAHEGRAFERFTSQGPLALLPMTQSRSSLVWCVPSESVDEYLNLSDDAFINQLQTAFGWRLGKITQIGERNSYPLLLRQSERLISHRFAVIGNAAQTLHPIAGQGFNLGLRDVITLAEEIAKAAQNEQDIGAAEVLHRYQSRREPDRFATVAMTSSLVQGFSTPALPLILGRNLGLIAMSAHHQLQAPLIQRALGLVTR